MNHSMISSMVSMNGIQKKLDILANNIANMNTAGFKRQEVSFEDVLTSVKEQPQQFQKEGRLTPSGLNLGWGSKLSQAVVNFEQGPLQETGTATDLALQGDGLFRIRLTGGAAGSADTVYTRDGSFHLTPVAGDAENVYMTTKEGHLVLGTDNNPIAIPNGHRLVVEENGQVRSYNASMPELGSVVRGQLGVVRILRPQLLQQIGDNLYTVPASIAINQDELNLVVQPMENSSDQDKPITVHQGFLEQSNVNLADEIAELMIAQRAFQLNSRALSSSDSMMGLVNNLRS